jgi:PGF-CTERM protein/surface glycoprotein (TIGR04207 family)
MTDDNSNPLRAVFLAALMVLWVFAGTVAFAGGAAAVSDGNLEDTSVDAIGDNDAGATTTYNISTGFRDTKDPANTSNPSGVAAVKVNFSEAGRFGGDVNNFTSRDNVSVRIEDTRTGTREVALQDTGTENGNTVVLDFQEKENVSDSATLYVNFTDAVINNPSLGDTYELQFQSYTDEGPSDNFKAQNASYTISGDGGGGADDERQTDTKFGGGATVWKGQVLDFIARPNQCNADRDSYQLRYYDTESGDLQGTLVREVSLNSSNGAQIPTKNVADNEEVVLTARDTSTPDNDRKIVDVGNVSTANSGEQTAACYSTTESDANDDAVEVVPQTINASFESDVRKDETAILEVDSNRNGYDLYVASEDFTQSELNRIVNDSTTDDVNTNRAPSDGSVRVNGINSSARLKFDFAGEATGNYSFTVSPTDTSPSDSASLEVSEAADGAGEFESDTGAFTVKRGDIQSSQGDSDATISITNANDVDTLVLFVGDEDRNNYETRLVVQPTNGGEVDIRMNTFLAGTVQESDEDRAYEVTNGSLVSVKRNSPELTGVLDEGQYDLRLENTDGEPINRGVLNIERSNYESVSQMRHPNAGLGAADEIDELANNSDLSDTGTVTMTDRDRSGNQRDLLVHEAQISGIFGVLDALADTDLDNADGNDVLQDAQDSDGIGAANDTILEVELEQINYRQNREPKTADYEDNTSSDQFRFVIDEDNETLYLVTDIRDLQLERETANDGNVSTQIETGEDYALDFGIGPGYDDAYEGGIDRYVPTGGTSRQLDVEDREAEFDRQGADQVQVKNQANVTISGQTNVAPGTDVTIQVDSTSRQRRANDTETGDLAPIFARDTAEVSDDGTFSADTFDFSENEVGRTFVVTSPGNGFDDDAEKPGVVVEGEPAEVALSDITVPADSDELSTVTVDSAKLPQGGFVTIHDATLVNDGDPLGSVRGTSDYLGEGEHSNVEITLDEPYTAEGQAIAMPHKDTNGNEEYDFVDSEGADDGPYTRDGNIVTDSAAVTFATPTPTATATDEPTPTETMAAPDTATATPDEDQPGFGAALALIALIGAALLAARRRDF